MTDVFFFVEPPFLTDFFFLLDFFFSVDFFFGDEAEYNNDVSEFWLSKFIDSSDVLESNSSRVILSISFLSSYKTIALLFFSFSISDVLDNSHKLFIFEWSSSDVTSLLRLVWDSLHKFFIPEWPSSDVKSLLWLVWDNSHKFFIPEWPSSDVASVSTSGFLFSLTFCINKFNIVLIFSFASCLFCKSSFSSSVTTSSSNNAGSSTSDNTCSFFSGSISSSNDAAASSKEVYVSNSVSTTWFVNNSDVSLPNNVSCKLLGSSNTSGWYHSIVGSIIFLFL